MTAGGLAAEVAPAPVLHPEALLDASNEDAVLWRPPGGPALVALGVARRWTAAGPERFRRIRDAAAPVLRALGTSAKAFAGFAYVPGSTADAVWRGFADAEAVLPRLLYLLEGERATLTVVGDEPRPALELERLSRIPNREASNVRPEVRRTDDSDAAFVAAVRAIGDGIASGAFAKVVAARRVDLELSPAAAPREVLERLARIAPACTLFAFRRGGRCFVGATPEKLIAKCGAQVRTEALAGSAPVGASRALLASDKDRAEHQHVVDEIRTRLAALGASVRVPAAPELRTLSHVLHLHTPISAQLSAPHHVLDLVAALHPTPAVGGVPEKAALAWLARHEPFARGWYASPVGWFDENGDGEFMVALRSAVLDGRHAHLFAGAGIVQGSEPDSELGETRLKLRALHSALGVAS